MRIRKAGGRHGRVQGWRLQHTLTHARDGEALFGDDAAVAEMRGEANRASRVEEICDDGSQATPPARSHGTVAGFGGLGECRNSADSPRHRDRRHDDEEEARAAASVRSIMFSSSRG